jgi:pentatricopeptide repeat domain-containing protein 1
MQRKGVDAAWTALEEMQIQGLTTDRFTVSRMLMKTVGEGRSRPNPARVYRGLNLVERFIQYQPREADEVLFNALLDTCCRIKDFDRLEASYQRMKELQIVPSHVTLGILVKAYAQAGDITKVMKVWDKMREQRCHANAVTFGCMIDACIKCGHMKKAMEIFHDMKCRRKHRNTILYTTLIKGCGMEKDLHTALTLFREMGEEGVPYNAITFNSIIDVCVKCGDLQAAEEILREMLEPGGTIEPDLITYSTLLKGYCQVGDLDKALQVAETIKACGLKCDELVYNMLMDGCVKANDHEAGIGLFAEMTQAGMKPSTITHSILVRLYQCRGYKGDCYEAVAQLYQHHGLERPDAVMDKRGKCIIGRRNDRSRNNGQITMSHAQRYPQACTDIDKVAGGTFPPLYPGIVDMPQPGALPSLSYMQSHLDHTFASYMMPPPLASGMPLSITNSMFLGAGGPNISPDCNAPSSHFNALPPCDIDPWRY